METKKNEKYCLEPKRPMFFAIGMILSLSLAITAFEWKTEIDPIIVCDYEPEPVVYVPIPVTRTPEPPKPKIEKVPVQTIDAVESIEEPNDPVEITDEIETPTDSLDYVEELLIEIPDAPPVDYAEIMPTYEGGMQAFYSFISRNIRYPRQAQITDTQGKVFVKFVVEKDGSLSDVQVIKGIGSGCDREALRVIKMANGFRPGRQGSDPVRVRMVIPVNFRLN